jgi:hypothetical protein
MGWSLIDCRFWRVAERRYRLRYSDGGHVEMTGKLNVGVFGQADILTRPYLNKIAYELIEVELNLRRCSRLPIYFDNRSRRHRRSRRDRNEYQAPSRPAGITRDSGGNDRDNGLTCPGAKRPDRVSYEIQAWMRPPRRSRTDRRRL